MTEKRELARLVKQVQNGDLEAFGQLYDRFYGPVFAYVLHQVGSPADAEDIVSGVFLDALQKIGGFTWRGAGFGAWLFSIARNDVMDYFRRQGRSREATITEQHMELASAERVDRIAEAAWDERRLREAVWQLSEEQQQVVLLKLMVNFSNGQIAAVLSKSEGAVKALQHRALENLRKIMESGAEDGTALIDRESAI
ncbi:MAG: sigma-70 family RNA polymerase sigma factor [Thermoleophilia bacterium]